MNFPVLRILTLLLVLGFAAQGWAQELASVEAAPSVDLPKPLSLADAERYRRIFALQEDAKWQGADREIAKLDDRLLMGRVLAQRYLHPTAYRSRYAELKNWLKSYADHPEAQRIYWLAKRRGSANGLRRPQGQALKGSGSPEDVLRYRLTTEVRYKGRAYSLYRQIRRAVRRGNTKTAATLLRSSEVKRLIDAVDYDRLAGSLAFKYFIDGEEGLALEWAVPAADRSGAAATGALWAAGMVSWKMGEDAKAARYFSTLAGSESASPWMAAAGGFWAARAHLRGRNPQAVAENLQAAARHGYTFYGLLARQILGLGSSFDWRTEPVETGGFASLTETAHGQRAFALIQAGQSHMAELELRMLYSSGDEEKARTVAALAATADMPALALRLSSSDQDAARYPVPEWQPDGGWVIDKALVFAFVRQESGFNPRAKSYRGARGLMQLMPATASFVSGQRKYRRGARDELFRPEVNLKLGQEFIGRLVEDEEIQGNMVLLTAAYNAGPGNVHKWMRKIDYRDDPLLFIESIPLRETRNFVERVLSNLWIYRERLGQPAPTLERLAAGYWPAYAHVDGGPQVAVRP